jgi:hypothetical protein
MSCIRQDKYGHLREIIRDIAVIMTVDGWAEEGDAVQPHEAMQAALEWWREELLAERYRRREKVRKAAEQRRAEGRP